MDISTHPVHCLRLSRNFMLHDFMASHRIVINGWKNEFQFESHIIRNGKALGAYLDQITAISGFFSISYGYISPEISERTVRWCDPTKPSLHRWDAGAAADIVLPPWREKRTQHPIYRGMEIAAPIVALCRILDLVGSFARGISYSESPVVCIGVDPDQGKRDPIRLYENRYMGKPGKKPMFINHSTAINRWARRRDENGGGMDQEFASLREDLKRYGLGNTYPSYHLGGKRQYQHIALNYAYTLLDFMRHADLLAATKPNRYYNRKGMKRQILRAANLMLKLSDVLGSRVSIIRGYSRHVGMPSLTVSGYRLSENLEEGNNRVTACLRKHGIKATIEDGEPVINLDGNPCGHLVTLEF